MKRSNLSRSSVLIALLLLCTAVFAADYAPDKTYYYDGDWHETARASGIDYVHVTGGAGGWRIESRDSSGAVTHHVSGAHVAPTSIAGLSRVDTFGTVPAGAYTTTGSGSTGSGASRTSSTSAARPPETIAIWNPPVGDAPATLRGTVTVETNADGIMTITSTDDLTGASTSSLTLPKGTRPDWSKYDPSLTTYRAIPIAGGGERTLGDASGTKYTDTDTNERKILEVDANKKTEIKYKSNTKPDGWDDLDPAAKSSTDFMRVSEEQISMDGVNGRLTIKRDDAGKDPVPTQFDNPQFYRAALESGVGTINSEDFTTIATGGSRIDTYSRGGRMIMETDDGNIASYSDSDYHLYVKDTPPDLSAFPRPTTTAQISKNSVIHYRGEGVGTAVDRATGELDEESLRIGESYRLTVTEFDDKGNKKTTSVEQIHKTETGDITTDSQVSFDHDTKELQYRYGDTGSVHYGQQGVSAESITALPEVEGIEWTPELLESRFKSVYGSNVQVNTPYKDKAIYNVNGRFVYINEYGVPENCFGAFSSADATCGNTDVTQAELSTYEDNILDPLYASQGLPSTNALQFAQSLDEFKYYANAYVGMAGWSSIMFDDEFLAKWRGEVNTVMCDMLHLGGSECWSSQICEEYVDFDAPAGTLVGETPDGSPRSIAHIEGEKSLPIRFKGASRKELDELFSGRVLKLGGKTYNLSDENVDLSTLPSLEARVYKITLSFIPNENTNLNVVFRGNRTVKWFTPTDRAVMSGEVYDRTRSEPIIFVSPHEYHTVCLTFNPKQVTQSGREISEYCVPLVEYQGAAVPPITQPEVVDASGARAPAASPGAAPNAPSPPIEGADI